MLKRTALLLLVAISFVACSKPQPDEAPQASDYDLLIINGTVYDGSGGDPVVADVAIQGDRIAAIGKNLGTAKETIDAAGLAVAPGFINMLSWATESLIEDGRSQSDIRQGVTLEVMGEGWTMGPINDAMKALPTREEIEHRLEKVLDAFPEEEDINGRLNQAISQIPDRQAILDHIDESVKMMPTAEDVLSRLDGRFQSIMPTRGEIQQSLSSMMESKVDHAMKQVDLPGLVRSAAPDADQFLEEIRSALPDRARFQDTIAQGINLAIENALPERMWLESLSKGLFDERTRGLLPSKDEVAGILREEIRYKLLETVEKIVRAQLERISTELNV